jgi:hypothetical protein
MVLEFAEEPALVHVENHRIGLFLGEWPTCQRTG